MTLIAALTPNSHAMLLGDILISEHPPAGAPLSPFKPTFLPSLGLTLAPDPNASSQIVTTRQKLAVITDNLAVGWSGDYCAARRVITAMRDYFAPGPITFDDFKHFERTACQYDDIYNSDLALVGVCTDNERDWLFGMRDYRVNLPFFGAGNVAGSGYNRFRDVLTLLESQGLDFPLLKDTDTSVALAKSIFITGYLSADEIYNPKNVHQYSFGGFYESMLMAGSPHKTDNVLFTYVQVISDKKRKHRVDFFPLLLIKMKYMDDIMLIRRKHLTYGEAPRPKMDDTTLVVQPIYRDVSVDEMGDGWQLNMNASHYCHVIYVTKEDGRWNFIVKPEISPLEPGVQISSQADGTEQLAFHDDFILQMAEELAKQGIVTPK